MSLIALRRIYIAIALATSAALVNGMAAQAQTTASSANKPVKIKSNLDKMASAKDYDFMLQLSAPRSDRAQANRGTIVAQNDGTLPSQSVPSTDGTTPSTLPSQTTPTTPNSLPSDGTQQITPNSLPSDGTQQTTPNSLPSDGTQQTAPNSYPSQTTPTTPNSLPSDGTQQNIPSDGNSPSLRDTQPTIPSDGSTPSDGSNPANEVSPGRATRSGSSYIGIGGNIGFGGNTGIGEGSFSVISKIGLTNTISVRPAALFGDQTTILVPVTLDFPPTEQIRGYSISPYIGAGAVFSTGDNSTVGALITGGVDVPITRQLTATAGLNVGFIDGTDVGLLIGVGYNFAGF